MGVMVYYWVQHENKAISSRFADLPATLCVAVYYHGQRTAELVRQQSFGCVAELSFPLLPKADRWLFDRSLVVLRGFKSVSLDVAVYYCFPTFADAGDVVVYYRFTTSASAHNVVVYSPWGCICRSALLPFLPSGASGFRLAKAARSCCAPGWLRALSLTYVCVYVDIHTYINAICI